MPLPRGVLAILTIIVIGWMSFVRLEVPDTTFNGTRRRLRGAEGNDAYQSRRRLKPAGGVYAIPTNGKIKCEWVPWKHKVECEEPGVGPVKVKAKPGKMTAALDPSSSSDDTSISTPPASDEPAVDLVPAVPWHEMARFEDLPKSSSDVSGGDEWAVVDEQKEKEEEASPYKKKKRKYISPADKAAFAAADAAAAAAAVTAAAAAASDAEIGAWPKEGDLAARAPLPPSISADTPPAESIVEEKLGVVPNLNLSTQQESLLSTVLSTGQEQLPSEEAKETGAAVLLGLLSRSPRHIVERTSMSKAGEGLDTAVASLKAQLLALTGMEFVPLGAECTNGRQRFPDAHGDAENAEASLGELPSSSVLDSLIASSGNSEVSPFAPLRVESTPDDDHELGQSPHEEYGVDTAERQLRRKQQQR